jgi:serine protease Do
MGRKRRTGLREVLLACILSPAMAASLHPENAFRKAIDAASPSVVRISASTRTVSGVWVNVPCASGVVLTEDGYVATCASALGNARRLTVTLPDGSTASPRVVLAKPGPDIAILKISHEGLKPVTMAADDSPRVGRWVLAIGDPFGLSRTRTDALSTSVGVVSAVKPIDAEAFRYSDPVILTDIVVNPGMTGGAMVDLDGRLIGICGPIVTGRRTNTLLSFAVPASIVRKLLEEARLAQEQKAGPVPAREKPARPGYLGVHVLDEEQANDGASIDGVVAGSPAEKAGLAAGDRVTEINGVRVLNGRQLIRALDELAPGAQARLTAVRNGEERRIEATLAEVPHPAPKQE